MQHHALLGDSELATRSRCIMTRRTCGLRLDHHFRILDALHLTAPVTNHVRVLVFVVTFRTQAMVRQ